MTTTLPLRPANGTADPVRIGPDTLEWPVWSSTARVVVTDHRQLDDAHHVVSEVLAEVDAAASRFRPDSELNRVYAAAGRPVEVSAVLADLVATALEAAQVTDGDVDPTVGAALAALGYDRDLSTLDRDLDDFDGLDGALTASGRDLDGALGPLDGGPTGPALTPGPGSGGFSRIDVRARPSWHGLRLSGRTLTVPTGTIVDLGATAKAWAADRGADRVARRLGTGVLVSLGGDIATAGSAPDGGWQIRVQDAPGEPGCDVAIPAGAAIATSSTLRRRWRHAERAVHHILNPRTLQPAEPVWRTVTVAAGTCVRANTLTTAAMVRGGTAPGWLDALGVPARLVRHDRLVLATRSWPEPTDPTEVTR